jgi:23S rRNA (uracil1939-C5)-methyltransferase
MIRTIVGIAARGDGIADDGGFHPLTAPGDTIDDDGHVRPGPHRVPPACRHFPDCGGCQLQHLDEEAYAAFLVDRVVSALAAQSLICPEVRLPHLSPPRSRRRVALTADRGDKGVRLGFNERASHRLIDVRECPVLRPELFSLLGPLRVLLESVLPKRVRGTVQMTLADQGVELLLKGVEVDGLDATERLTRFASDHGLSRLSVDEGYGPTTRWEPSPVTVTLGGVPVPFPQGAFLQATCDGEEALVAAVRTALAGTGRIMDLFAGLGTFALSLEGATHAAEGGRDAALSLLQASRQAGRTINVQHRDLFRRPLTVSEMNEFEAVVLDPPRAGAQEQVAELASSLVARIAYVSCNPATFARDARLLVDGGYRLEWVQPVGQFRWSTHVELVAAFSR